MNTTLRESPAVYLVQAKANAKKAVAPARDLLTDCFHFQIDLQGQTGATQEMSDDELLVAAENAGTFRFLDSDEEEVYRP